MQGGIASIPSVLRVDLVCFHDQIQGMIIDVFLDCTWGNLIKKWSCPLEFSECKQHMWYRYWRPLRMPLQCECEQNINFQNRCKV